MYTGSFINDLYRGSENVNLMRKKIDRIVTMILGLVKDDILLHPIGEIAILENDGCVWILNRVDSKAIVELHFLVDERPVCLGPFRSQDIDLELVVTTYNNLQLYVEMMSIAFPGLERILAPFLEAANQEL